MVAEADLSVQAGISRVAQRVLHDDANLLESLRAVASAGRDLLGGCSAASITIVEGDHASTIASTNDVAVVLDQVQYSAGDGPCLTAAVSQRVVHLHDTADARSQWPEWAAVAKDLGVASSLSIPVTVPSPYSFAGLNLYGTEVAAFDGDDEQIAAAFAGQASAVVSNVVAYWAVVEQSQQLGAAMASRAVIEQAKGILMAAQHCTADEAFELLRRASQRENRKLRDIAGDIVERAASGES